MGRRTSARPSAHQKISTGPSLPKFQAASGAKPPATGWPVREVQKGRSIMADISGEPLAGTVADALAERGEAKAVSVLWLGIAAGLQIGFGGIAYLVASAGMPSGSGATHLLAGLAFS